MVDARRLAYRVYSTLPAGVQTHVREGYLAYVNQVPFGPSPKADFVTEFFDNEAAYRSHMREFEDLDIAEEIDAARTTHRQRTGHGKFAAINQFTPERYYALLRDCEPTTVVETGVCNGVSTLIALRALEVTGKGHLYSIDVPDEERLPETADPGWIVPDELRNRWTLTIGRSQEKLPEVLSGLDGVDLFFHDSLECVLTAEVEQVWPKLREGGVLVADDIYAGDGFCQIAARSDAVTGNVAPNVGYAIKRTA